MINRSATGPIVLLVEDDAKLRTSMKEVLEENGYTVVCAQDGYEASMKMKNQNFNIVISDLNMPKKDGVKLANEIVSNLSIPVLLITGELENFQLRLNALEGVMLLPKPFKIEIVPALVSKILKTSKVVA
jgi:DNA-binding response OmpR family regulator